MSPFILEVLTMKIKFLGLCILGLMISACTPGVYNTRSSYKGGKIFVSECSPNNPSLCKQRAKSKCGGGYTNLSQKTFNKTYRKPVYRQMPHTRYRTIRTAHGYRHVPYTSFRSHVAYYRTETVRVSQLRFSCR